MIASAKTSRGGNGKAVKNIMDTQAKSEQLKADIRRLVVSRFAGAVAAGDDVDAASAEFGVSVGVGMPGEEQPVSPKGLFNFNGDETDSLIENYYKGCTPGEKFSALLMWYLVISNNDAGQEAWFRCLDAELGKANDVHSPEYIFGMMNGIRTATLHYDR